MDKQAYMKMMGINKKALTELEQENFLQSPVKDVDMSLKMQKELAAQIAKLNKGKTTRAAQLKNLFTGKGLKGVQDTYTGSPFLDTLRNQWRFLIKGK